MKLVKSLFVLSATLLFVGTAFAGSGGGGSGDLGAVATQVTGNLTAVAKLITAGSYIAGLGCAVGAILKFKAHKDNPTQIPVGTPIALVFIAAALLFAPSIFSTAGNTLFSGGGTMAGPSGIIVS